ncbi:MAG TPA: bifunctional phosphopantothenoylcysteine decarboxylase/phosphopantothenate--cysteine ligase CoaBC, partial [Methanomicrobiales archaeon]|nr:bifunctional phosphopantothenoylcysteine decarboxylase/phosphopantothenate--cysteine ligase CoaBC [Methanomicrobiales archaeon]
MAYGAGRDALVTRRTLEGRVIALGVTGSIAAVEVVGLAHALRRRGAEIQPVMTPAAARIIHPDAVTYACGRPALTALSGMVEHVEYCGEGGKADLLLVAPCTANTLAKMALGIDDTPVTSFASTAIGRGMPVVIAPAMHASMYRHPAVTGHLKTLAGWGVDVIGPRMEEEKAKLAAPETIVLHVERALMGGALRGKRVLVTSGPCAEPVDDVRVLTTRSTGKMGREMALEAYRLGADVTVVHQATLPCVRNIPARDAAEMRGAVLRVFGEEGADIYVSAAAVSDFSPRRVEGKIRSGAAVNLRLDPLPKLLDEVLSAHHPAAIAFKLGRDEEVAARDLLGRGVGVVVINPPETMGAAESEATILTGSGTDRIKGS